MHLLCFNFICVAWQACFDSFSTNLHNNFPAVLQHFHGMFFTFSQLFFTFMTVFQQLYILSLALAMDAGVVRRLDIRTLLLSLFVIIAEILRRFRVPVHIDFAVNPIDIEQPPDPPVPQRPRAAQGCDQVCRFCDQPCHRHKFGHSHHSCHTHRHWRD